MSFKDCKWYEHSDTDVPAVALGKVGKYERRPSVNVRRCLWDILHYVPSHAALQLQCQ